MLKLNQFIFILIVFLGMRSSIGNSHVQINKSQERELKNLQRQLDFFKGDNESLLNSFKKSIPKKDYQKLEQAVLSGNAQDLETVIDELKDGAISEGLFKGVSATLQEGLKKSLESFKKTSSKKLEGYIREKMKGIPGGSWLAKQFPRLITFLTELIKDPSAVAQLLGILKDRGRLMIYAGINIFIILLNFLWKRSLFNNKDVKTGSYLLKSLRRIFVMKIVLVSFFFFYWYDELYPTLVIFRKVFL